MSFSITEDRRLVLDSPKPAKNSSEIVDIEIPSEWTEIAAHYFRDIRNLGKVIVPVGSKLRRIEASAFEKSSITELEIKSTEALYIGNDCFSECDRLVKASLGKGRRVLGDRVFMKSTNIDLLMGSITSMGTSVFEDCKKMRACMISDYRGVTIPACTFSNCQSLGHFVIPQSVCSIDDRAFHGTESLKEGKLTGRELKTIAIHSAAFGGSSFKIPDEAKKNILDEQHFLRLVINETVDLEQSIVGWKIGSELKHFQIPSTIAIIRSGCFKTSSISEFIVPNDSELRSIEDRAFIGSELVSVKIENGLTLEIGNFAFSECLSLKRFEIRKAVLGNGVFKDSSIECFSGSILRMGESVFENCEKMKMCMINVKDYDSYDIPANTFSGCSALMMFKIPSLVMRIMDNAFKGTSNLGRLDDLHPHHMILKNAFLGSKIRDSMQIAMVDDDDMLRYEITSGSMQRKTATKNINFKGLVWNKVTCGKWERGELVPKKIVLPLNISMITNGCFKGSMNVLEVEVPTEAELRYIGRDAFRASSITELRIKSKNEILIDDDAFRDCEKLRNVDLRPALRMLGNRVFQESGVRIFTAYLKEMGVSVFEGCTELVDCTITGGLSGCICPIIPARTFKNCVALFRLTSITSRVYTIDEEAFANTRSLTKIITDTNRITPSTFSIHPTAFSGSRLETNILYVLCKEEDPAHWLNTWNVDGSGEYIIDSFVDVLDTIKASEMIRDKDKSDIDLSDNVTIIGENDHYPMASMQTISDMLRSPVRPVVPSKYLGDHRKAQIIGYLIDYVYARVDGYQFDDTIGTCIYISRDIEINDLLFECCLGLAVDVAIAIDLTTHQLQIIGNLITPEWAEAPYRKRDDNKQYPTDLTGHAMAWIQSKRMRICTPEEFLKHDEQFAREAEQSSDRRKMWRFGHFMAAFSKFLKIFRAQELTKTEYLEYQRFVRSVADQDDPFILDMIDKEAEEDQMNLAKQYKDPYCWVSCYDGFFPEYNVQYAKRGITRDVKLPHDKVITKFTQMRKILWSTMNKSDTISQKFLGQKTGQEFGCIGLVRLMAHWSSVYHESLPCFIRYVCTLIYLPHNWFTKPEVASDIYPLMMRLNDFQRPTSDIKTLVAKDFGNYVGLSTDASTQCNLARFWVYVFRITMMNTNRVWESYEDLLFVKWRAYISLIRSMRYSEQMDAYATFSSAEIFIRYLTAGARTRIMADPRDRATFISFIGVLYEYQSFCLSGAGDPDLRVKQCKGKDMKDSLMEVNEWLGKYLQVCARKYIRATGVDWSSVTRLLDWYGFESFIRFNRKPDTRNISKVFGSKKYFITKVGINFPTIRARVSQANFEGFARLVGIPPRRGQDPVKIVENPPMESIVALKKQGDEILAKLRRIDFVVGLLDLGMAERWQRHLERSFAWLKDLDDIIESGKLTNKRVRIGTSLFPVPFWEERNDDTNRSRYSSDDEDYEQIV